ncbi:hypothetical protein EGW08_000264 [Elysia chlorotica]|uniref:Uncharacterized protein n=1 Tax=Elysia chlorotica TaxID=188477 RepID=A0A433UDX5_ELYCH|nr:hypothetical protein EGW08_000264 [Elysia chlorotica]
MVFKTSGHFGLPGARMRRARLGRLQKLHMEPVKAPAGVSARVLWRQRRQSMRADRPVRVPREPGGAVLEAGLPAARRGDISVYSLNGNKLGFLSAYSPNGG